MSTRAESSIRVRNVVIAAAVVAAVGTLILLWDWGRIGSDDRSASVESGPAAVAGEPGDEEESGIDAAEELDENTSLWVELTGQPPRWPQDLAAPANCEEVEQDLDRLCAALDLRVPALREQGGARVWIERLAEDLALAPPDPAAELRSYDTLLRNVFHLFRIAGRGRMNAARRVLSERELAEPAALTLFRWAISREDCSSSGAGVLPRDALTEYAGFLFNSLGGQAYLRRRSPRIEALACFYGLQVLDDAIRNGHNPQGYDPRAEIPRCRQLVASQPLVFSERYVEGLDALALRWRERGSPAD